MTHADKIVSEFLPGTPSCELPGGECEVRLAAKKKSLGHIIMSNRLTLASVKKELGFSTKAHYKSMLKAPSDKLRALINPTTTVDQLKTLAIELSKMKNLRTFRRHIKEKTEKFDKETKQRKKLLADLQRAARAKIRKSPKAQIVESIAKRKRRVASPPHAFMDTGTQKNVNIKQKFVTGIYKSREEYNKAIRNASSIFWNSLPQKWKEEGIDLYLFYDFFPSDHQEVPKELKRYKLSEKFQNYADFNNAAEGVPGVRPALEKYEGHHMTRLDAAKCHGELSNKVHSFAELQDFVYRHLLAREALEEIYDPMTGLDKDESFEHKALFHIPNHFTFSAHRRRFLIEETYGNRTSYLFREVLSQNDAAPKDCCTWQMLIDQTKNTRYPIPWSIQEMQEKTGLGNRIALHDPAVIAQLEDKLVITHGKKKKLNEPIKFGIVLHDMRLRVRRLPPYQATQDKNYQKTYIHIVLHNKHVFGFQSGKAASDIMMREISFFGAYLLEAEKERLRLEKVNSVIEKLQDEFHHIDGDEWPAANEKVCSFLGVKPKEIQVVNLYEKAWNLFRETQHLQPDRSAIRAYLEEKLGIEPDCVRLVSVTSTVKKYRPRFEILEKLDGAERTSIAPIPSRGLELKCSKLGIGPKDFARVADHKAQMREMGLVVPEVFYDMRSTIAMDLETCSIQKTNGNFLVYSGRYRYSDWYNSKTTLSKALVAQTEADLNGGLMWTLLQQWKELRERHDAEIDELEEKAKKKAPKGMNKDEFKAYMKEKTKKFPKRGLYVYAHNGSKFDAIAAIHSILANSDEVPANQLESNGKFISFTWKGLIFRDSCLITMSSLKSACTSWGLETSKGYLPHRYLQNCKDANEVLSRLHGKTTWKALEPYMDWFGEADDTELHTRKAGRLVIFKKLMDEMGPDQLTKRILFTELENKGFGLNKDQRAKIRILSSLKGYENSLNRFDWEDWRDQQPVYKFWEENKDVEFNFLELHNEYLAKDVDALWELCDRMGTAFARDFGSDIRTKCTLGSNAEHIWMHTLMKPIPKLQTKEQHDRWQRANRGGFCGALSQYDFTAMNGEKIYKVDVTSLYPASSCPIKFETAAGVQEPLKDWYRGFPDVSRGWLLRDFKGVEMTKSHYDQLSNMHGLIRVEFDQNGIAFPFFLKKMEHKTFQTLAPVMQGEDRFIIPHVRMAFDMGVKVKLFDCEYTTETREVYQEYMDIFAQKKNGADGVIKELNKTPKDQWTKQEKDKFTKATYDRTVAKLFLNGLLGRNNMKIERPQTLLTRGYNDIVCLNADDEAFKSVNISEIKCGEGWCYRAKFKEGDYSDHVKAFNVCPYISAYMLGYSKMLMQCSFQFLAKIGAKLLYTDTDSIAFSGTPEQWKQYSDRFVPMKKTFGGMELEGEYRRLVTIGPKKYACIKDNGTYEWACNGLPARHNTKTDVLDKYLKVLGGEVVNADYFSINATTDFRLLHTTGASKKLRFISLKGAVENGSIRWWKTEEEFREYASSITVIGWEDFTKAKTVDTAADKTLNTIEALPQPSEPQNRPKRKYEGHNPTQEEQQSFVYVLTDAKGRGWSYVGYSNDPVGRLIKHNSNAGDAVTTSGERWIINSIYEGFTDKQNALRFEGLLKMHSVVSVEDFEGIANKIISEKSEYSTVYKKL